MRVDGVSLGGKFVECVDDGRFLLLVGEIVSWVEEGDADVYGSWCAKDAVFGYVVCGCSPEGRPGECAGLFKVVSVPAEWRVKVFADHDAGFDWVIVVDGFNGGVDGLVGVFSFLYRDDLGVPVEVVVDCGAVSIQCDDDVGILCVLGGDNKEKVWVVFDYWLG